MVSMFSPSRNELYQDAANYTIVLRNESSQQQKSK
jgi:hypothetical protein